MPVVVVMVPVPLSRLQPSRTDEIEDWPYLDEAVLLRTRSRKVCMTCQLHQGLIAHGEHLTSHCQGWTDDQVRQKGWAPEVA
jgi:hypothetical protein